MPFCVLKGCWINVAHVQSYGPVTSLSAEALTVADSDSPGLSGVKEDQVEVEVEVQDSEAVVGGGEGTDPS